jgi:hypothetical protein
MKVIEMTLKDHVPRVPAPVAVVFIMQRLVQVTDEMNREFKGLYLSVFAGSRVFQNGEELFRLGDNAVTIRALAGQVYLGIRQGDVDIVPRASLAVVAPVTEDITVMVQPPGFNEIGPP